MLISTISILAQDSQQHRPPVREGMNPLPPIPSQEISSHQNNKGGGGGDHVSTSSSTVVSRSSSVMFRRRTLGGNQQPPPSASADGLSTVNNNKSPLSNPNAWEGNMGNTAWRTQVQTAMGNTNWGLFFIVFVVLRLFYGYISCS